MARGFSGAILAGPPKLPRSLCVQFGLDVLLEVGKAARALLIVDGTAIEEHDEPAIVKGPETEGLQPLLEVANNIPLQPGGGRVVVSGPAVLNLDVHGVSLSEPAARFA